MTLLFNNCVNDWYNTLEFATDCQLFETSQTSHVYNDSYDEGTPWGTGVQKKQNEPEVDCQNVFTGTLAEAWFDLYGNP